MDEVYDLSVLLHSPTFPVIKTLLLGNMQYRTQTSVWSWQHLVQPTVSLLLSIIEQHLHWSRASFMQHTLLHSTPNVL